MIVRPKGAFPFCCRVSAKTQNIKTFKVQNSEISVILASQDIIHIVTRPKVRKIPHPHHFFLLFLRSPCATFLSVFLSEHHPAAHAPWPRSFHFPCISEVQTFHVVCDEC